MNKMSIEIQSPVPAPLAKVYGIENNAYQRIREWLADGCCSIE